MAILNSYKCAQTENYGFRQKKKWKKEFTFYPSKQNIVKNQQKHRRNSKEREKFCIWKKNGGARNKSDCPKFQKSQKPSPQEASESSKPQEIQEVAPRSHSLQTPPRPSNHFFF